MSKSIPEITEPDFYIERGYAVFTRTFLLRRGICCGSGCRHCPYGNAPDSQTNTEIIRTDVPDGKDSSK